MKKTIKKWIKKWLEEEANEFSPKKDRDLRAVCFSSESPINSKHRVQNMLHCTEWVNGEGFNFDFTEYNELTKKQRDKHFSLHENEIQLLLACLNDMGRFEL